MALEQIGLGGIFTFDGSQGVRAMQAIMGVAKQVGTTISGVSKGVGELGSAMGGLGVASLPLTAATGAGVKVAADFEKQMSAVGAVAGASSDEMKQLELKAKQMGATTVFSASQAAEGMELLARGGFNTQQIMDSLGGVMAAAAADGITLAESSEVISATINGMGLEVKDAQRVADVLAKTSASTASDIKGLGVGFSYAAAEAKTMGVDFETTAAAMGAISDAGITGSSAGTSLAHMLQKLAEPSKKGAAAMAALGVQLAKNQDGSLNLIETTKRFNDALKKVPDMTKRAAMATEIFGVQGQKAMSALGSSLDKGKLEPLVASLQDAAGSAEKMAKTRTDNLLGKLEMLGGAVEGFILETFSKFLGPMSDAFGQTADLIGNLVLAMQELNGGVLSMDALSKKYGKTTVAVAMGILEGFNLVIEVVQKVRSTILEMVAKTGGSVDTGLLRTIAKFVVFGAIILGVIAPFLIAISGVVLFITSVLVPAILAIGTMFGAIGGLIGAVFTLPIIAAVATVLFLWYYAKDQIMALVNSLVQFILAAWDVVSASLVTLWNSFWQIARPAFDKLMGYVSDLINTVLGYVREFVDGATKALVYLKPLFVGLFEIVGNVAGKVFAGLVWAFGNLVDVAKPILNVFKEIALFIIEYVVRSVQTLIKAIVKLADAMDFKVPQGLRDFAAQEGFNIHAVEAAANPGAQAADERAKNAKAAADAAADNKNAANEKPKVETTVMLEDKRQLDIHNCLRVDGKEMALATGRHKQEINERAGFKATRWQQRFALEQGATPIPANGGG